jgi:hypothetical protein
LFLRSSLARTLGIIVVVILGVAIVIRLVTFQWLSIRNTSGQQIESLTVSVGEKVLFNGPMPPNDIVIIPFRMQGEGAYTVSGSLADGAVLRGEIGWVERYVIFPQSLRVGSNAITWKSMFSRVEWVLENGEVTRVPPPDTAANRWNASVAGTETKRITEYTYDRFGNIASLPPTFGPYAPSE